MATQLCFFLALFLPPRIHVCSLDSQENMKLEREERKEKKLYYCWLARKVPVRVKREWRRRKATKLDLDGAS